MKMPKEALAEIMKQINRYQGGKCRFDTYDPTNIWDKRYMADLARDYSLAHPRDGQPDYSAGISEWCAEAFKRETELRNVLYRLKKPA